jgi:hypothetical protein
LKRVMTPSAVERVMKLQVRADAKDGAVVLQQR